MKNKLLLIITLVINFCITNAYSQDHNIEQLTLKLDGTNPIMLHSTVGDFQGPNSYLLGFQWGNSKDAAKSLFCNQNSAIVDFMFINNQPIPNVAQDNAYLFISDYRFWSAALDDDRIMHSHSMTWEPNMLIGPNDTQWDIIAKRPDDPTQPVFGFMQKNGVTPQSAPNVSFLEIPAITFKDEIIFSNPWASEYLWRSFIKDEKIVYNDPVQKNYQGYNFCVSVNLKRWGNDYDMLNAGDTVLEIKLPYILHDTNAAPGLIKFYSFPTEDTVSIITTCQEHRGFKTIMQERTVPDTCFYITKAMLPSDSSTVTVTARFRCWGKSADNFSNPRLSDPYTKNKDDIKKIGLTATYRGGCPIAIDYVRISSPHTVDLLEGKIDSVIRYIIQSDIDTIRRYNSLLSTNLKIWRFNDISEGSVQNFDASRYVTKLIGDVFAAPNYCVLPVLHNYYVQQPERILQCGFLSTSVNAPYIEKGRKNIELRYKSLGLIAGRKQRNTYETILQTIDEQLNSVYETYYPYKPGGGFYCYADFQGNSLTIPRILDLNVVDGTDSPSRSFQAFHQFNVWNTFYNKTISGFQYLDKPWYFQTQNLTWWENYPHSIPENNPEWLNYVTPETNKGFIYDTVTHKYTGINFTYMNPNGRPFTAEETRAITYSALIQGCKGLYIDGVSYIADERFTRSAHDSALKAHPFLPNDDPYEYLMRDDFGGDFFNYKDEADPTKEIYFKNFRSTYLNVLNWSDAQKNTFMQDSIGCSLNRIYLGRKSVRTELYKIHLFIRDNDATLKSLSLQAAYGKGIFKTYNQHPSYSPSERIIARYIDTAHITTRKIFQPHTNLLDSIYSTVPYSTVELEEEQFYDLTILKYGQEDLINHMVIALQNRRTDPLRLFKTRESDGLREICFITDSEMDSLADNRGENPLDKNPIKINQTKDYWKDYFRKSFGYREISLPIRRLQSTSPTNLVLSTWGYLVKDLTYKYPEDISSMKYWMKDAYDHQINQFVASTYSKIPQFDTVNCKLRPGEAKFLDIRQYWKEKDDGPVSHKLPYIPPPTPLPLDTCELLTHGMELYFKKCDTTDANNCLYEIYYINKSDSMNFYVPISVEFNTDNKLDTTYNIPSGFQYINIKKHGKFQSIWLPDSILSDTTYLGTYKAVCDSSQVVYKLGTRDCYSTEVIQLRCGICACCDSVEVDVAPVQPLTLCRLFALPKQQITLSSGDDCNYYGMAVTGGFTPQDNQPIADLSIPFDTLAPINLSTYNESMVNPFSLISCNSVCYYCLHFSFLGKNALELCSKDYCITIDNSQIPINISPNGILSPGCYAIMPQKINIPSEELHYDQIMIVDPNPTTGKANVKLNLENDLVGRLVLYTSTGELIKEIFNGKLPSGTSDYQIDLSSQPSGMYIITIESDGMQYIKKFVKE